MVVNSNYDNVDVFAYEIGTTLLSLIIFTSGMALLYKD
jgi:uncharacterized membrane protein